MATFTVAVFVSCWSGLGESKAGTAEEAVRRGRANFQQKIMCDRFPPSPPLRSSDTRSYAVQAPQEYLPQAGVFDFLFLDVYVGKLIS